MGKVIDWLFDSHRWVHIVIGLVLGVLADGWYCAGLCGGSVGGAMEGKDWQWGGKPDWVDFGLTLVSCIVSYYIKTLVL